MSRRNRNKTLSKQQWWRRWSRQMQQAGRELALARWVAPEHKALETRQLTDPRIRTK